MDSFDQDSKSFPRTTDAHGSVPRGDQSGVRRADDDLGIIGVSTAMVRVRRDIVRFAPSIAPVVILGETGTGKELVARALHDRSPRAKGPFLAINVACLPRETIANELFGHDQGAFTGALGMYRGLFEQADRGTILLDEIGELPLELQAMLLRVLETGEVRRLGGGRAHKIDVRVVAATHRDLPELVRMNQFRADLWYRLHALAIDLPPLRRRHVDIPHLARHALVALRDEVGERELTDDALTMLAGEYWPGNVRELFATIRRAAYQTDARMIDADAVAAAIGPAGRQRRPPTIVPHGPRVEPSPAMILQAFAESDRNISRTSRVLGIARSTVRDRLKRLAP